MQNLFAYIDNEILTNMNELQDLIFGMIPLSNNQGNTMLFENINQITTPDDWKSLFDFSIDKSKNILEQAASITCRLCSHYLYPNKILRNSISMEKLQFILKSNKETGDIDFEIDLLNRPNFTYEDELKNIMILSYSYIRNINKKRISNENSIITDYMCYRKNTPGCSPRVLNDKLGIIKKNNSNQIILPQFLSDFDSFGNVVLQRCSHLNICSYLDIEIIVSLLNSRSQTKNPFITKTQSKKEKQKYHLHLNVESFLENFSGLTLNEMQNPPIFSDSNNTITLHHLIMHNQFCLERLTNTNFINALYGLYEKQNIPSVLFNTLTEYIHFPLVKTRLDILKFYYDLMDKINKIDKTDTYLLFQNFYAQLANELHQILLNQLFCTIPIVIVIFQYIMSLLEKDKSIEKKISVDMNTYFEQIYADTNLHFFRSDEKKLYPNKKNFPVISPSKLGEFSLPLYNTFDTQSRYFTEYYSFPKYLYNTFRTSYPQWLKTSLSNVTLLHNSHFTHFTTNI